MVRTYINYGLIFIKPNVSITSFFAVIALLIPLTMMILIPLSCSVALELESGDEVYVPRGKGYIKDLF